MPASVARGIILSIAVIAALGLAVIENPTVQEWLEEQRKRVIELLRTLGEELDPQTRRTAEAFAYDGRSVADDENAQREAEASLDAATVATGRNTTDASVVRRIAITGPVSPEEAEERQRKGREYLARRESELYELQQKRKAAQSEDITAPPTPTSFDALVDEQGNLKTPETLQDRPESSRTAQPVPELIQQKMKDVEQLLNPQAIAPEISSASEAGWQTGSQFGNPFGDEYALDRSITPRPPIPPKIAISEPGARSVSRPTSPQPQPQYDEPTNNPISSQHLVHDDMSYEDQLALALALSHDESLNYAARGEESDVDAEDDDLKAAIAASLKDMEYQRAAAARSWPEAISPQPIRAHAQPLVDLSTPDSPAMSSRHHHWELLFARPAQSTLEPASRVDNSATPSEVSDELYRITPHLARARLADPQPDHRQVGATASQNMGLPFDPVYDSASSNPPTSLQVLDSSFYSAPSELSAPSVHMPSQESPLHDEAGEQAPQEKSRPNTPRAPSSIGFGTETWSETLHSDTQSPTTHELPTPEVVDLDEDSDIDMLSEVDNGFHTPDSWSEVGSRDGESDVGDETSRHAHLTS